MSVQIENFDQRIQNDRNIMATNRQPIQRTLSIADLLTKYWYYLGIVMMFLVGWIQPSIGLWMKSIGMTPYLVAIAFFLNGFALSTESLLGSLKQWRVLCAALGITFGIAPLIVLAVRHLIPGGNTLLAEGFQIVSLVPTLFVSAVVLTRMARGNAAVALYLTITSNLLAIIVAPLLIKLTLGASGENLHLASTTVSMLFTVLLPTLLGQLARRHWEAWAERHAKFITVLSQCTILIFI
ncbi:MAG TPA: bile acid:sodium symporter, partial [Armatimonadota bacterium]|nr:bile acid:sodium symporter [Armatimonadota bacterium]